VLQRSNRGEGRRLNLWMSPAFPQGNAYHASRPLPWSARWPSATNWRKCCFNVSLLVPVSRTMSLMVTSSVFADVLDDAH